MHEVALLPGAIEDYENAAAWYRDERETLALEFEAAFSEALERVAIAPLRSPIYDSEHRFHLLKRFPYSIVFQIDGNSIVVVAVAHAKRRPGYWREQDSH